mmetsp:Transcript_7053/g.21165  ORF Transcript_7053/g.21165 Transcript_7053/m.21165 type:complete len:313 (-) Transcript_7053:666-1604(-)
MRPKAARPCSATRERAALSRPTRYDALPASCARPMAPGRSGERVSERGPGSLGSATELARSARLLGADGRECARVCLACASRCISSALARWRRASESTLRSPSSAPACSSSTALVWISEYSATAASSSSLRVMFAAETSDWYSSRSSSRFGPPPLPRPEARRVLASAAARRWRNTSDACRKKSHLSALSRLSLGEIRGACRKYSHATRVSARPSTVSPPSITPGFVSRPRRFHRSCVALACRVVCSAGGASRRREWKSISALASRCSSSSIPADPCCSCSFCRCASRSSSLASSTSPSNMRTSCVCLRPSSS